MFSSSLPAPSGCWQIARRRHAEYLARGIVADLCALGPRSPLPSVLAYPLSCFSPTDNGDSKRRGSEDDAVLNRRSQDADTAGDADLARALQQLETPSSSDRKRRRPPRLVYVQPTAEAESAGRAHLAASAALLVGGMLLGQEQLSGQLRDLMMLAALPHHEQQIDIDGMDYEVGARSRATTAHGVCRRLFLSRCLAQQLLSLQERIGSVRQPHQSVSSRTRSSRFVVRFLCSGGCLVLVHGAAGERPTSISPKGL